MRHLLFCILLVGLSTSWCGADSTATMYANGLRHLHERNLKAAVAELSEVAHRQPWNALAHLGLSRALLLNRQEQEALRQDEAAEALRATLSASQEEYLNAWGWRMKAVADPDNAANHLRVARWTVDYALALYPRDVELWVLRGDISESDMCAAPFYIQALRLQPRHPLARRFHPKKYPPPDLPTPSTSAIAPASAPHLFEGLGHLSHPLPGHPRAQAYFDQGLRCLYAYVTNAASQSFRYAITLDGRCAMAYWGLSMCVEPTGSGAFSVPGDPKAFDFARRALQLAQADRDDHALRYAAARILQLSGAERRNAFLDALDAAIASYPEDIDLWIWRGQVYSNFRSEDPANDMVAAEFPYELAAWSMQHDHPAPNHEMVHLYETINRPLLGFPYARAFLTTAPNMPHAQHMHAHLAMRVGRWEETLVHLRRSLELSAAGYPELDRDHHRNVYLWALCHTGRFAEAARMPPSQQVDAAWSRLLWLKGDMTALEAWCRKRRALHMEDGFYYQALLLLQRGDWRKAEALVEKLPAGAERDELSGRVLVARGHVKDGLQRLREVALRGVPNGMSHRWGQGSFAMESWGQAALQSHRWSEAREAFSEALAHEHGSIVGALGMQVVCERTGQKQLAQEYAARATRIWKNADAGALEALLSRLRHLAA